MQYLAYKAFVDNSFPNHLLQLVQRRLATLGIVGTGRLLFGVMLLSFKAARLPFAISAMASPESTRHAPCVVGCNEMSGRFDRKDSGKLPVAAVPAVPGRVALGGK